MNRKVISLTLVLLLICTLFTGCRESKITTTSTIDYQEGSVIDRDASDEDTLSSNQGGSSDSDGNDKNNVISNPLAVNLKGATITIYQSNNEFTPDSTESKASAAKVKMLKKIEDTINCKLSVKTMTANQISSYVAASAASGNAACDIYVVPLYTSATYITGGFAQNLKGVSTMDLSKDYMNFANVVDASTIAGKSYALAMPNAGATVTFFNKRILSEIGSSDKELYSMVKKGTWTLDKFRELARKAVKDLDGVAGMSEKDQWGITGTDIKGSAIFGFLNKNNAQMVKMNSAGKLIYNMEDSAVISTINLINDAFYKDGTGNYSASGDAGKINFFMAGNSLFLCAPTYKAGEMSTMKDDFGLVPMPNTASGSKTYKSEFNWNYYVCMISSNLSKDKKNNAGAFLQAYSYLYDKQVLQTTISEYENRCFCDEESADMFDIAISGMQATTSQFFTMYDDAIQNATTRAMYNYFNGESSLAEGIEKFKQAAITSLNDINAKLSK